MCRRRWGIAGRSRKWLPLLDFWAISCPGLSKSRWCCGVLYHAYSADAINLPYNHDPPAVLSLAFRPTHSCKTVDCMTDSEIPAAGRPAKRSRITKDLASKACNSAYDAATWPISMRG